MATKQIQIPISEGFNLSEALDLAKERLEGEQYTVVTSVYSPQSGKMTVSKDMDGIKQYAGMGVECEVNFTVMNGTVLDITVNSLWTNKIIALAVGWVLCWVPFITGCIGCANQSKLPQKIEDTLKGVIVTIISSADNQDNI